jgi:hypothetical protein
MHVTPDSRCNEATASKALTFTACISFRGWYMLTSVGPAHNASAFSGIPSREAVPRWCSPGKERATEGQRRLEVRAR